MQSKWNVLKIKLYETFNPHFVQFSWKNLDKYVKNHICSTPLCDLLSRTWLFSTNSQTFQSIHSAITAKLFCTEHRPINIMSLPTILTRISNSAVSVKVESVHKSNKGLQSLWNSSSETLRLRSWLRAELTWGRLSRLFAHPLLPLRMSPTLTF